MRANGNKIIHRHSNAPKLMYSLEIKRQLNHIKCPICQGPIDIATFLGKTVYGCAVDIDHYHIEFDSKSSEIVNEFVRFYDEKHKYQILKNNNKTNCNLYIYNIDSEKRVIEDGRIRILYPDKSLFDFRNFNVAKAITRVKLLLNFS